MPVTPQELWVKQSELYLCQRRAPIDLVSPPQYGSWVVLGGLGSLEHHHQENSKRSKCSPVAAAHGDKLSLQPHLADAQIHLTSPCEQVWGAGRGREFSRGEA